MDELANRRSPERAAGTPLADGMRLPARFAGHSRTLLSWPCRDEVFGPLMPAAKEEWAEVARAIARFEPVTVVARLDDADDVRGLCGTEVDVLTLPLDDSWIRDNGPIFVRDADGAVAAVGFGFDGWNGQFTPYDDDALVPERLARAWDLRFYQAPFVLEGGAFNSDGEGTLLTTEQCLWHNRNLGMARCDYEATLREWLGIEKIVWLPFGLVEDSGPLSTAGHVDDVAQFVAPGVVLAQTAPPGNPNHGRLAENIEVLREATDVAGRRLEVVEMDLLPQLGVEGEEAAYELIAGMLPGREVVGLPVEMSAFGGGGLGCITQQVPAGQLIPAVSAGPG